MSEKKQFSLKAQKIMRDYRYRIEKHMPTDTKKHAPSTIIIFCIVVAPLKNQIIYNKQNKKWVCFKKLLPILPKIIIDFNSILA